MQYLIVIVVVQEVEEIKLLRFYYIPCTFLFKKKEKDT